MNIIQHQAQDLFKVEFNERSNYEDFVQIIRSKLFDYRKEIHKLEFIEHILTLVKLNYDKHLISCQYPNDNMKCPTNRNYEHILFFLQNEREELVENLPAQDFTLTEKIGINESVEKIIEDLSKLQLGQQITYDDLMNELNELKDFYFLNKKHWSQLLIGRLSEMVAGGIISETICKDIVESVTKNYSGLIQ
jgi:hypothetical protein